MFLTWVQCESHGEKGTSASFVNICQRACSEGFSDLVYYPLKRMQPQTVPVGINPLLLQLTLTLMLHGLWLQN